MTRLTTVSAPTDPLPLRGERVVLRRLAAHDLAAFQAYRSDPELARFQGWSAQSDADARAFIDEMAAAPLLAHGEWLQLGIAGRADDALLGDIGLHVDAQGHEAEIGFTLSRPAQGRGLATEAVALALQLLWQHTPVACVLGITDVRNHGSLRLLERLGFRLQERRDAVFKGEACVEAVYRLERPASA
jgi:RimJ/RimL family protein N-acetyltransferase